VKQRKKKATTTIYSRTGRGTELNSELLELFGAFCSNCVSVVVVVAVAVAADAAALLLWLCSAYSAKKYI